MSRLLDRLTFAALCLLSGMLVVSLIAKNWHRLDFVPVVRAQNSPGVKTIVVNKARQLDPIEVTQILESGKEIMPGDPSPADSQSLNPKDLPALSSREFRTAYKFPAGDDWLRGLEVVLRNRTSKNIVQVVLNVAFPETAAKGPMAWPRVRFGQLPANVAFYGSGDPIPPGPEPILRFPPGRTMGFNVTSYDSKLRAAVERSQPFSTVSMCYIHFIVTFEDGMHRSEGGFATPDPARLGESIPAGAAYFPGQLLESSAD